MFFLDLNSRSQYEATERCFLSIALGVSSPSLQVSGHRRTSQASIAQQATIVSLISILELIAKCYLCHRMLI